MSQVSTSIRAAERDATTPADTTDQRILDAAYASVMAIGVRRTTLKDVAQRAGLSRMTVYRRYSDVTSVLQGLMAREFGGILGQVGIDSAAGPGSREQVIETAIRGLELISTHELFMRLLEVDPELLLPYMTSRPGRFQAAAAAAIAAQLKSGMEDGSIRRDDPDRLAESIILAMRGHAFAALVTRTRKQQALVREDLHLMLDGLLRPGVSR